ncbi:MAG: hypothetical protein QNJ88_01315 [Acidimicrobiia bacterium]|nr:hypothetical protein [Acidimicrobiia bacterium]
MQDPTSSRDGPPPTIVCVDCGGTAHLLTRFRDDEPPEPGDRLIYRCEDCNDRWDLIVDEEDFR